MEWFSLPSFAMLVCSFCVKHSLTLRFLSLSNLTISASFWIRCSQTSNIDFLCTSRMPATRSTRKRIQKNTPCLHTTALKGDRYFNLSSCFSLVEVQLHYFWEMFYNGSVYYAIFVRLSLHWFLFFKDCSLAVCCIFASFSSLNIKMMLMVLSLWFLSYPVMNKINVKWLVCDLSLI
jgi:hypothetical protein